MLVVWRAASYPEISTGSFVLVGVAVPGLRLWATCKLSEEQLFFLAI